MSPSINTIQRRVEEIEGVDKTIIKTGYSVWIHAILESKEDYKDVRDRIKSADIGSIKIDSSYNVGGGILKSSRKVIKIRVS